MLLLLKWKCRRNSDKQVKDLNRAAKVMRKIKNSDSFFKIDSKLGTVDNWHVEVSRDASLGNLNEGVDSTGEVCGSDRDS